MTTVSPNSGPVPLEMVQANELTPTESPVTVALVENGSAKSPLPLTNIHKPDSESETSFEVRTVE